LGAWIKTNAQYSCSEIAGGHGIASANTATAKPWPLPANRTVNILVLWGVEIEHIHTFDEAGVSPCDVVEENEKLGKKTANINTKKLEVLSLSRALFSVIEYTKNHFFLSSIWPWM